ncbi:MAG: hypothetical protein H6551_04720 [Chitinophagales bacterium]|nr:hypothetical protein [Chitinophagaceae bacterium]MCB9064429.1 hypothetical protein [Chitinophagales bacterium]
MKVALKVIYIILSALLGALFLYSAYTKTLPIQTFEYTLVEFVHFPWWLAAVGSRLLIGLETALGVLMILNIYGNKKWILKLSLLILATFSIYLIYLWATVGDDVNCGCFGDAIWMSPSTSLLKNLGLILATLLLLKFHDGLKGKIAHIISIVLLLGVTSVPFFYYPIPSAAPSFLKDDKYEIDLSALYKAERPHIPDVDLRKGKHIIAFMSLTCPHCKIAAYKMQLMKRDNPNISMFMVLNGDSTDMQQFWDKTKAEDLPHEILLGQDFVSLSGLRLPAIYWVDDSWVVAKSDYITLNQQEIENWIESKE